MGVFNRNIVDDTYNETDVALPNGAATTHSTVIDLGDIDATAENYELEVSVPALAVGIQANGETLTANVVAGATTTPTAVILGSIIVMTGADGAGSAAASARVRLPSTCARYIRVQFVNTLGDKSTIDATVGLRF